MLSPCYWQYNQYIFQVIQLFKKKKKKTTLKKNLMEIIERQLESWFPSPALSLGLKIQIASSMLIVQVGTCCNYWNCSHRKTCCQWIATLPVFGWATYWLLSCHIVFYLFGWSVPHQPVQISVLSNCFQRLEQILLRGKRVVKWRLGFVGFSLFRLLVVKKQHMQLTLTWDKQSILRMPKAHL